MVKNLLIVLALLTNTILVIAQQKTYCNPVNIDYGYTPIPPDKLYNCIMVHDANEYYYKGMDKLKAYYYCIEAINENGISPRTKTIKVE